MLNKPRPRLSILRRAEPKASDGPMGTAKTKVLCNLRIRMRGGYLVDETIMVHVMTTRDIQREVNSAMYRRIAKPWNYSGCPETWDLLGYLPECGRKAF